MSAYNPHERYNIEYGYGCLHIPKTIGTGSPVCETVFILDAMLCISCTISDVT